MPFCAAEVRLCWASGPSTRALAARSRALGEKMPPAFQGALSAPIRTPNICPKLPYSHEWLHTFELTDANYPAKSYAIRAVKTLDGSSCEPRTRDGTAMSMIDSSKGLQQAQICVDFGVSNSKVGVQQFKTGADAMAHAAAQPHPGRGDPFVHTQNVAELAEQSRPP